MPQISNLSFNVSFEPHNPNRVGLTNTTPSLPAGFVGIFKVTQPDGYVRNGDINTPDVTNVVSSCVVTLVPDSAGQLQQGQYIIEFIGNAPGYLSTSFIRTFTLQYTAATISLRNDFDIFTPQLAYTDISNYSVSGWTISSGPTRKWDATSPTTGTISGTNSSIDIRYNNQYYAENYTIQFEVNVAYASQAYPWLTITHTRTQTTSVTACIPKSLEDLTQAVEALREESNASCGGDWAKFEKANALYAHLLNMLRLVLIAGQYQDGFFDVYQQLLTYIQNGSVACTTIGQVIPPYDFSDYESSIYDGQSSYCQLVGDGVNTTYRVNHQLGDTCVVVQVYEVATGKQVFCDLAVSTINSIDITFYEPPTLNQYRVVAVAGAIGLRGQGFQPGGLTGQILRKKTNADFDTEWADVTVALPLLVPYTGATQDVFLGEFGIEAGYVRFDTTPTAVPAAPAVMSWNDSNGTVALKLKGNSVSIQLGQEMVSRVVNKTGTNLLASQYRAVRVRKVSEGGAQGQRLAVVLAQANTEFLSTDMLGIVTENISNNQEGFITTFGAVKNINTTGSLQGETWVDGDILFLSPTVPGGLTNVKPSAPNHLSIVGYVEYAHQNNGKIFVHVQTSWELDELHNVAISSPTTGQVLRYDGTLWRNAAIPAVTSVGLATSTTGVTITDTPVTSSGVININIATASVSNNGLLSASDWATFNAKVGGSGTINYVPKFTAAGSIGNSQIFDNGANVGVGTASPTAKLDVSIGNINLSNAYYLSSRNAANTANLSMIGRNTGDRVVIDPDGYGTNIGGGGSVLLNPSGGQVAIGTSSPVSGSVLDIAGSTNVYPRIRSTGTGEAFMFFQNTNSGTTAGDGLFVGINSGNDAFFYNAEATPARFFTSATERLRITSAGNVGIGTTSPNGKLDVANAGDVAIWATATSAGSAALYLYPTGGGVAQIASVGAVPLQMLTNGAERMRIFANGRIGVNTTTDAGYQFDVNGTARINNTLQVNKSDGGQAINIVGNSNTASIQQNGSDMYFNSNTNTTGGGFFFRNSSSFTTRMAIDASGNVGIGTASPAGTAERSINIFGSSTELHLTNTASGTAGADGFTLLYSALDAYLYNYEVGFISFGTSNAERLRISSAGVITVANLAGSGARLVVADASGNLSATTVSSSIVSGSGTTNYIPKFTAASTIGNSQIVDNGASGVSIGAKTFIRDDGPFVTGSNISGGANNMAIGTAGSGGFLQLYTNNTDRLIITSGGNVGIGTASPGVKLEVVGSAGTIVRTKGGTGSAQGSAYYVQLAGSTSTLSAFGDRANIFGGTVDQIASIYTGSSIPLTFDVNAAERMRIFANGRVGVNTTTDAGYQFDINGTLRSVNGANFATSSGNVGIGTTSPTNAKLQIVESVSGIVHQKSIGGYFYGTGFNGNDAFLTHYTQNNFIIGYGGSTGGAPSVNTLTLTNAGNVGIGTTTPLSKFHMSGGAATFSTSNFTDAGGTGGAVRIFSDDNNGGKIWAQKDGNTAWGYLSLQPLGGNVGIGTASPSSVLHVYGPSSGDNIRIQTAGVSALKVFSNNQTSNSFDFAQGFASASDNVGYVWNNANAAMVLGTNATERLRITSGGNVGIGTATAGGKLTINSALGDHIQIQRSGQTDRAIVITSSDQLVFGTWASPTQMVLASNGRLLLNTTIDAGDYKLQVAGNVYTSGLVDANYYRVSGVPIVGYGGTVAQFAPNAYWTDVELRTNNISRLRIDVNGNVGIGTTSPDGTSLRIVPTSTDAIQRVLHIGYNGSMSSGTHGSLITFGNSTPSTVQLARIGAFYEGSTYMGSLRFYTNADTEGANPSERMRITQAGNVGIGTTSPVARLDVFTTSTNGIDLRNAPTTVGDQASKSSPRLRLVSSRYEGGNVDAPFSFQNIRTGSPTNDQRLAITNFGDVEVMSITNSGNVGIGDVALDKLTLIADQNSTLTGRVRNTNTGASAYAQWAVNASGNSWGFRMGSSAANGNALDIVSDALGAPTSRMRITTSGHVGIGVTPSAWGSVSPSLQLGVSPFIASTGQYLFLASNSYYDGTNAIYTSTGSAATYAQSEGRHIFNTAPSGTAGAVATYTERMRIFNNGRVAINTTTDAGYQLDVNGGTRVTGRVTVTGNDTLGLSIARAGTSAISSEIYNGGGDNGWLLWGVESSAGGVIFPGTTAYASVFGSFRNVPIQFATNNTVRMTIDGGGSVGIGVASPSASAILQADSTTKGMLPPRMTTTQRDAITSPATGLIVYDTTVNKLSVYNGTTWKYAQYE